MVGGKVGASSNFATFSAQFRTLLLRKWLEEPWNTLLILSDHVIVSGVQILQEYSRSLLTFWTVRYQVLLLMLR